MKRSFIKFINKWETHTKKLKDLKILKKYIYVSQLFELFFIESFILVTVEKYMQQNNETINKYVYT